MLTDIGRRTNLTVDLSRNVKADHMNDEGQKGRYSRIGVHLYQEKISLLHGNIETQKCISVQTHIVHR